MHIVTITTTTPAGQHLDHQALTTPGTRTEAIDLATNHARRVTIDIHASDPYQQHIHLIALGDEPYAVAASHLTDQGRTDLLGTLNAGISPAVD